MQDVGDEASVPDTVSGRTSGTHFAEEGKRYLHKTRDIIIYVINDFLY